MARRIAKLRAHTCGAVAFDPSPLLPFQLRVDEAVLEEVEEGWKEGIPQEEMERFGILNEEEEAGKGKTKGGAEEEEDGNGARHRRKCGPNSTEGVRWRRRYRARAARA